MTKTKHKILSVFLSFCMIISCMVGMTATAQAATEKTVAGLGTSAIGNPTSTESTATAWAGSYVYYGKYNNTSTKYRVLDKASNDFGVAGGSLLLDCDTKLYKAKFDDSGNNAWSSSSLRSGLQGNDFLKKSGVFTDQEKGAIASSTKEADVTGDVEVYYDSYPLGNLKSAALSGDTVFVLDAKEASRASYGYASNGTRKKSGLSNDWWWLRSPYSESDCAGIVDDMYTAGMGGYDVTMANPGVSPAFNINLSSVIFASAISGESGSYKLTLKDDKMSVALTSGQKVTKSGDTLTIPYTVSGDNAGNATQVSVLVTDKAYTDSNATILTYGKLADVTGSTLSGEAGFDLPSGLTGTLGTDYHIYLLAEDVNGEKETDYANLKEITTDDISSGPDKTALNDAITAAETLYNSIKDNTAYTTIANTLKAAIDTAKAVAVNEEAEQDAIDTATTNITTAKTTAETALFDAYKNEKITAAGDMAQTGDSAAATKLITDAKNAIDALTYDTSKTLDENKAAVDAVITKLTTDLTDQRAADDVIKKINALPTTVTTADKNAIKEAREAYDGLTDNQKAKISDTVKNKLETAETAVVAAEFNEYKETQKTAAENKAQTGDSDAVTALITAAKDAIDDITYDTSKTLDENKAAVDAVITKLTTDLTDQRAADDVIKKINALPTTVTTADKDAIEAARAAYDALTPAREAKVGDEAKKKLETAEAALAIAELPAASDVTTTHKTAIEAARTKYDALTDAQKEQVGDEAKKKLEAAEAALAIAELPAASDVTTTHKTAIEAARTKYDALTDDQKSQVGDTLKEKLEAAEVALTKKLIEAIPDPLSVTIDDADKVDAAKTAYDKLTDDQKTKITEAEKEKLDLAVQALRDAETTHVEALINALPSASSVTTDDAAAIEAAKEAFDELTEAQKAIVKTTLKDKLAADLVALAIAKLPAAENVTATDKDAIEAARAAYDALTSTQKSSVGEAAKEKLEAAEAKIQDAVDTEAANAVKEKINALPASTAVTVNDKANIEAARAAYDALTDNQKAKIEPDILKKLTDAEAALQDAEDKAAADAVKEMINALPASTAVTVNDKADIEAARAAYDALTDNQKTKIEADILKKLTDAEAALQDAVDSEAAKAVKDKINALPASTAVTVNDKAAIEAARAAYDALTDNQKAKVSADTLKKLTDAEAALALAESKDKLDKTISSATAYYDSIKNRYPTIAATLKNAIDAAQAVLDDKNAEKADIDAAVTALNTAVSTARTAVSYAGGGSSTPSYVPSYSPSNTTTTTTTTTTTNTTPDITKYKITGEQDELNESALTWDAIPNASAYSLYVKVGDKYVLVQDLGNVTNADIVLGANGKYYVSTGGNYNIYTYVKKTGTFKKTGTLKASKIDDVVKANNVTNNFMIKYKVNGKKSEEKDSYKVSVNIYYKPAVQITADKRSITLKWNKVPEATKYRVYKYVNGKLKTVTELDGDQLSVRITGTKAGKKYSYAVKAYVDGKWTKVYKSDIVSVKAK